jgi:hypothetical protein
MFNCNNNLLMDKNILDLNQWNPFGRTQNAAQNKPATNPSLHQNDPFMAEPAGVINGRITNKSVNKIGINPNDITSFPITSQKAEISPDVGVFDQLGNVDGVVGNTQYNFTSADNILGWTLRVYRNGDLDGPVSLTLGQASLPANFQLSYRQLSVDKAMHIFHPNTADMSRLNVSPVPGVIAPPVVPVAFVSAGGDFYATVQNAPGDLFIEGRNAQFDLYPVYNDLEISDDFTRILTNSDDPNPLQTFAAYWFTAKGIE